MASKVVGDPKVVILRELVDFRNIETRKEVYITQNKCLSGTLFIITS